MGETDKLVRFEEETSPSKFIALIGVLFMIFEAIAFFYASDPETIFILYGIIEILLAAVVFFSLSLFIFWKIKLPYFWWLLLIVGVILLFFDFLAVNSDGGFGYPLMFFLDFTYFPAILILFAGVIELIHQKKEWKASEIFTLFGAGFGIYDCILVFGLYKDSENGEVFTYAFFGLIAIIVMLLAYQDWFDIRIPFTWWGLLTVGLLLLMMVTPLANLYGQSEDWPVAGFGGVILLIAFALHLKDF
ncbi:MAG: hypothetical protein KGD63_00145 [Candidatus Lokiarchaeota archaeon]|nr:hypothetical protein [Candidatus Lokiarchaeota archaeon]